MVAYRTKYNRNKDTLYYNEKTWESENVLWLILVNALDTLNDTFILKNLEEYFIQLKSDKQEDKKDIFWNVGRRKLLDSVLISIAFENVNKAILMKKGFLIHKIKPSFNKKLAKKQREGNPIKIEEFFNYNYSALSSYPKEAKLNGLFDRLDTINYSHTLNEKYQKIIKLNEEFVFELKKLNEERNRLHFFTGNKGVFEVSRYIKRWSFIKEESFKVIRYEIEKIEVDLRKYD